MEAVITSLVNVVLGGGKEVMAVLILIIGALLWDRRNIKSELAKKEEKLDKIVDDYHKGNLTLSEALNSLKTVLSEIKSKL